MGELGTSTIQLQHFPDTMLSVSFSVKVIGTIAVLCVIDTVHGNPQFDQSILDATWKSLKENIDEISSDKVIEDARGMISKEELNLDQSIDSLKKGTNGLLRCSKRNE